MKKIFGIKKPHLSLLLTFLLVSTFHIPTLFAQKQSLPLPEGAIAMLGKGRIYDMQYAPDGTRLAVATSAGIWLYDTITYQELALLTKPGINVDSIAFSPDGSILASADESIHSANGYINLWNTNTGSHRRQFYSRDEFNRIAFSPDGKTLVTGYTGTVNGKGIGIHLWDPQTGAKKTMLKRPPEMKKSSVYDLAFSPNGLLLASGNSNSTISLWNAVTGKYMRTLAGHKDAVYSVAFSPDSKTLASGGWDKSIRLWDTDTGKQKQIFSENLGIIRSVAFNSDGSLLAGGGEFGLIHFFDPNIGEHRHTFRAHSKAVIAVTFNRDMGTVASGSVDGSIRIWDAVSGEIKHLFSDHYGEFTALACSPDGKTIATPSTDQTLYLWDVPSGTLQKTLNISDIFRANDITFNPEGTTIATVGFRNFITLRDRKTGEITKTLKGHQYHILSVDYSPDGKTIVSGSLDRTIRLWDADTGAEKKIMVGHEKRVLSVMFSPDGKTIISSDGDDIMRLWDVNTGKERQKLTSPFSPYPCMAFSPDGKTFATAGPRRLIDLQDVETANLKHYLVGYKALNEWSISSIAFSPNGKLIAAGNNAGIVTILESNKAKDNSTVHLHTFKGHRSRVDDVAFVLDGKAVASRGTDGVVYLWDLTAPSKPLPIR